MAEIKVPELGESISEGTLVKWIVKEGDSVNQGDVLAELETDKVNLEISAEESGVVQKLVRAEGDNVLVGEVIAVIGAADTAAAPQIITEKQSAAEAPSVPAEQPATSPAAPAAVVSSDVLATPAARKYAREKGIDLREVPSRDPFGRVNQEDVKSHAAAVSSAPSPVPSAPQQGIIFETSSEASAKPVERRRMSRRRQTIANRLVQAQHTAAMLTTFNEVDMTAILDVRKRRKDAFKEKYDVNLGFMSFFTKAVVGALKTYPLLNAEIDGDDILVKKFYDIGIAVSAKEGLVVPVVRDANKLGFAEIEKEILTLANKARSNTLSLAELQGGTFTITNGGVFGSLLSTPILNAPQVGILGMHKIQLRPVAIDAERMENRPMMYIALSYDHRIVDGAEAVGFLVKVKELLEDPESLLLEG
ncbi:2-oxoglutarate dehydrogenase complex dihydrolipoyllysine-residue succinyltransferase [Marinicrinis lubricantis]|uniref:Dihydrolipoyllysine-residue succinyltransferase component of 2-oxoglutarate dehydrogenase complex n=1 Tax=Marinicrinis lubricantis TaxID=2086470 RepID=A0ABW1IN81_9BACL